MNKLLSFVAVALVVSTPAVAQNAGAGAAAGAEAAAAAQAASGSTAAVILNSGGNGVDPNGNPIGSAASPLTSQVNYGGSYQVKNNPGLAGIGAITAHVCALSAGGTASGAGFGFGLSTTYVDEACRDISQAGALAGLGKQKAALIHMAMGDESVCVSLRQAGDLPKNQICTSAEKKAAEKAAKSSTQKSTRVAAKTPKRAYAKCDYDRASNKVTFRAKFGANKATAKSQCMSALGL